MQSCPITCATRQYMAKSRTAAKQTASAPPLYRVLEATAKTLRWAALEELLSAIPDSNDDFGIS